jgi:uncharacterized small protein (DUF1192 family)
MNRVVSKKNIQTGTATVLYQRERRAVLVLSSLCAALICGYIYCISFSILSVVMRSEIDERIAALGSDIGELEAVILSKQGDVGREALSRFGLREPQETVYITRTPANLVVRAHDES